MSEDMLRRSRILVVCGTAVDETVLTDIADCQPVSCGFPQR